MHRTFRSVGMVFLAVLGAVCLAIASAFTASLAYGAVALIVPGTGTPNANIVAGYLEQARDRYLKTTACGADGSGCPDQNLQGIDYPASLFPLAFIPGFCRSGPGGCDTLNQSVTQGTTALNTAINAALNDPANPDQTVVVFGYSQGGAVVADSLDGYINGLSAADKARIQVVTIGGVENPDGGFFQRLAFLKYIPFFDISLNPPMKPDTGVNYTSYGFQYDPVVNAPRYFGNAIALANALAAFETVHGYYLAPDGQQPGSTLPFGYTDTTLATAINCTTSSSNCRKDHYGNTYVTIPALTLPIYDLLLSVAPAPLKPLLQPIVNLLTPATRLLIDIGYDTTSDPSVPTPLSILPFNPATFNPITFAGQFAKAIGEGIFDARHGISTQTPTTTTASTPAAKVVTPKGGVADTATSTTGLATASDRATNTSAPAASMTTPAAIAESTPTAAGPTVSAPTPPATTASVTTKPATPAVTDTTANTATGTTTNTDSVTQSASTGNATKSDITTAAREKSKKKDGVDTDTQGESKKDGANTDAKTSPKHDAGTAGKQDAA